MCPCSCVLFLSFTRGFTLSLLNSTKSITWGKKKGYFTEICNSFLQSSVPVSS
ncbi:hypothetical protein I79_001858 [Cricetulus griseus]|uniref:Uncharacterized protein n=1 Tax=Cricetulus griseus TaxID=10029 RepID=G3GVV5_CRIGR|nr:hypothetical protein I79_001858 [Cricetulus griseus]